MLPQTLRDSVWREYWRAGGTNGPIAHVTAEYVRVVDMAIQCIYWLETRDGALG